MKHGEAYLIEKIELVKQSKLQGKIKKTPAQFLVAAVNNDYQDGKITIEIENKKRREVARQIKAAEVEESEKAMAMQREERQKARDAVAGYLSSLDGVDLEKLETDFVKETNLNPQEMEAFHDWVAERQDL